MNYLKIEKNDKVYLIRVGEGSCLLPESKLAMFNDEENQALDKAKVNP